MTVIAADNFNRANGAPGANWTAVINSFTIVSNAIDGTNGADYNVMYWNADAFPDDQYSQLKISAATDGGPAARITGTNLATAKLYYIDARTGSDRLLKLILGTETQIASLPTYLANDIAKLHPTGTSIQAYKNGIANGSPATDSAAPTGSAGVAMFSAGAAYEDWEGGTPTPPIPPLRIARIMAPQQRMAVT